MQSESFQKWICAASSHKGTHYVCMLLTTPLVQCDQSTLFTVLLIIKFSPVFSRYFTFIKPFYEECLIYMHGFDDHWWATWYVFRNTDARKHHHTLVMPFVASVRSLSRLSESDSLMVSAVYRAFWTLVHLEPSCPKTLYQTNGNSISMIRSQTPVPCCC